MQKTGNRHCAPNVLGVVTWCKKSWPSLCSLISGAPQQTRASVESSQSNDQTYQKACPLPTLPRDCRHNISKYESAGSLDSPSSIRYRILGIGLSTVELSITRRSRWEDLALIHPVLSVLSPMPITLTLQLELRSRLLPFILSFGETYMSTQRGAVYVHSLRAPYGRYVSLWQICYNPTAIGTCYE